MAEEFDEINNLVRDEVPKAKQQLIAKMGALGMKHGKEPLTNITTKIGLRHGIASRIQFKIKRSGVFVHKGVGRGTKISQVGSGKRVAKQWFNPVIEEFADELISKIGDQFVEISIDKLKIR